MGKKNKNEIRLLNWIPVYFLLLAVLVTPRTSFYQEASSNFTLAQTPDEECGSKQRLESKTKEDKVALPKDVPQDWYSQVQKSIADAEYEINWQEEKNAYSSPNRAQNLRFDYYDNGFRVTPREEKTWEVTMTLSSYGKGENVEVTPGSIEANKNTAKSESDDIAITYENTKEGMRQNFLVKEKPEGTGNLQLHIDIESPLAFAVNDDGRGIGFIDRDGQLRYRYVGLKVTDASGKELSAGMQKDNTDLTILVNDNNAQYPILIDPLSTSANWTTEGDQVDANFGASVASAGDVNGDGYSDVIVGATNYDNGQADEGRAFVYYGSSTGLSISANWTAESNQASAYFGYSVASAGDVNGDGYSDVIVGAYNYDNGQSNEGQAFVYQGGSGGLSNTFNWTAESNQINAWFGFSVSSAGDVNGDGYSDVTVGAYYYDNGQTSEGRAFVYHGSASGLSPTSNWTAESNQVSAWFGYSVASAGDVNGDGYSDVIVGAWQFDNGQNDEGRAFVYHGSASGLSVSANWTAESDQVGAKFGIVVSTAGDANGDGYSDVIVGAHLYDNGESDEGRAFVYHGSASGLSVSANWTAESDQVSANFGNSVAFAGDVNGDGYSDVTVGAYYYDNGQLDEGRAFVYYGSASGLSISANWTVESDQVSSLFGINLASAGDVNGDGYSDVIVGAHLYDDGQLNEGRAFVYHGSAGGLSPTSVWTAEGDQDNAFFGYSVASAGDVNGDGYSDVIVGAFSYDNGQTDEGRVFVYHGSGGGLFPTSAWAAEGEQANAYFGNSVASAGDVNGDGYSDVIVGAFYYDNGQSDEGRAFVYHGSVSGLSVTSNWTMESNQTYALFGCIVSSAGDVNGDGYSDVIVGAYNYDNGQTDEGRAFVYHGSGSGLSLTSGWTSESDQVGANFGTSVAAAGDVNGDGYSDVIVGAFYYDNGQADEGRAFVYHGSASGLSVISNWTAESNQINAYFGYSVSSAGDVNGDGYSDVLVGSINFDNGQMDEGRTFVYHGSAGGLLLTSNWTAESDQPDSNFGLSVSSAGDVNGDGYSDVIVGATSYDNGQTNEGRVFVYHGSAGGLSPSTNWTTESDQAIAIFGNSVACAGDVNGDGYSDVIVGAYYYDNGQLNEGRAFVYYGNNGGVSSRPRLFRVDLATPIALLGRTHSSSAAGARIRATAFMGRADVKAVFETKRLGMPFDGTGLTESAWTDPGTAGVNITQSLNGLSSGDLHKVRTRLKYSPVSSVQPYGRWLYLQGNGGLGEADFLVSNVAANEPATQSSNITFTTPPTGSSITMQWTTGNGTGRILIARAGSPVTANPVDGKTYSAGAFGSGAQLSTGQFVVYNGSGNSTTVSGLSGATTYHFRVFEYTGASTLENYNVASATNNPSSAFTLASEPTTQSSGIVFNNVTSASITLSWSIGNGSERLVVGRAGSPVSSDPVDGTAYTGDPDFNLATPLNAGEKILYRGSGNSVNVSNLSTNTAYHFKVFELNGTGPQTNYFTSVNTGNPANRSTLVTEPSNQPTSVSFSSISESSMTVSFTAAIGTPNGYLALVKAGASPTEVPVDGTTYVIGNTIGTSTVRSIGSATTFGLTGLTANTVYHVDIFAYNGTTNTYNYLTTSPLEESKVTTTIAPTLSVPATIGQSSFQISWAAVAGASDYALDVSLDNFSTLIAGYSNKLLGNVTSTNVTGLINGILYKARLRAINNGGASVNSNVEQATTIPATPFLTSAFANSSTSITINWNAVIGAQGFLLDISSDNFLNFVPGYNGLGISGPTSYTATGLLPLTSYQVRLRSQNGAASPNSNSLSVVTLAAEPLAQPTGLVFSNVTTTQMSASFTNASGSPAGYLVLYKSAASPTEIPVDGTEYVTGGLIGTSTIAYVGSFNTFSLTGLNPNAVYFFDVFSYNGSTGTFNYLITSPLEGSRATSSTEPASQPTSITFGNVSVSAIDVAFTAATGSPTGYLVLRKAGSAPTETPVDGTEYGLGNSIGTSTVAYVGANATFTNTGLSAGTNYFYAAFAFNGSTNTYNYLTTSPLQGNAITKPASPVALDATNVISGGFKAKWNASTGADSYELDVATAQDFSTLLTGYNPKSVTITEETLSSLSTAQTNYWYRVRAVNASGKSANSNLISLTTPGPTTTTELVISQPVVAGNKISVTLSNGSGTRTVRFFSKGILAPVSSFVTKTLTSPSNSYETNVTSAEFDELGLEYYFTATDDITTTPKRSPELKNGFISSRIAKDEKSIPNLSSGGKLENYRIISIPYKLDDNLVGSIFGGFGDHKIDWRLMHYEGGKNKDYPAFPRIEQGKGYWFNTIKEPVVKIGAGTAPENNKDNPFTLSLAKEWNQIGNPFPFDIKWSAVLAANPGAAIGKLKVYDPTSATLKESDDLKMWSGGFVLADNASDLTFPVALKNGRVSEASIASKLNEAEWFVPLTLTYGIGENNEIGFGMHPQASISKDRYDDVAVPRFFNYLEFTTKHDEFFVPNFGRDVVPTTDQYTWSFTMNTNLEGEGVSLNWNPAAFGTNAAQLLLFDVEEQVFINMRSVNYYSFTYRDNRSFKFLYSSDERTLKPDFTMLGKPYPNPASQQVTVPVVVKENQTQLVIEVIDLLGRRVKLLSQGEYSSGIHDLTWSCDDEQANKVVAGIYLIQMKLSKGSSQVQKVVVK